MIAQYELGILRYSGGATDSHGNPVGSWSDPEPWMVYGIAPGASEETRKTGADVSHIVYNIHAPRGIVPGRKDRVVVDGELFEVEGEPRNWTRGPFAQPAWFGVSVELNRSEG